MVIPCAINKCCRLPRSTLESEIVQMWYSLWPLSLEVEVKVAAGRDLGEQVSAGRCEEGGDFWEHMEAAEETQLA